MSVRRVLVSSFPTKGKSIQLAEEEAHHVTSVLRLSEGDRVEALNGAGRAKTVALEKRGKNWCAQIIPDEVERVALPDEVCPVAIHMAMIKSDGMEWAIEKCVELGVKEFYPTITQHTVVRVDKKGPEAFQERWQKIADQALKQCGRLNRMVVFPPEPLAESIRRAASPESPILWFDEASSQEKERNDLFLWLSKSGSRSHKMVHLFFGPEGGWNQQEIRSFESFPSNSDRVPTRLSLGPIIMRADTAVIACGALLTQWYRTHS